MKNRTTQATGRAVIKMTATYIKSMGTYRITLSRSEAETLAYSGTMYSHLFDALKVFKDSSELTIYGNKYEIEAALKK